MLKKNENLVDRLLRALLSVILAVAAYYWLSGGLMVVAYIASLIMAVTAIVGFCGIYTIFKIDTNKSFPKPKRVFVWISALLIPIVLIVGAYASSFFSKKLFLEDFNAMNNYYKQALFYTGQEKRQESVDNYDKLLPAYAAFKSKYSDYQPAALRGDKSFKADLDKIDILIKAADQGVRSGDLKATHYSLEAVRPIWQEIFKRNGFSMLAVALVDFHDAMEKVIEPADDGDAAAVQAAYADADQKLEAVEEEVNDSEIQAIRTNLDKILELAKSGANKEELAKQAAALKSSFIKVYLKRG